ncbi:MAG: B12-binding domain-containing protein [Phycisphaerales bacterium]|nr:B12-binding domain-containing protein [Phycisphaerales bacterium]
MSLTPDLMSTNLSRSYMEPLLNGNRDECRRLVEQAIECGIEPRELLNNLIWPTMELLQDLYREDRISIASLNMATRLNRTLTDQITAQIPRQASNGKTVLIFCGDDEPEELGGQLCADLFECEGYTVRFAGGGLPYDESISLVGEVRPDLLILFGTLPRAVPAARKLIDQVREINSCPQMQIMCCGGIYKRAEGLAEEMGADLYAPDAGQALQVALEHPNRRATSDQRTVGRGRRLRKATGREAVAQGLVNPEAA